MENLKVRFVPVILDYQKLSSNNGNMSVGKYKIFYRMLVNVERCRTLV